MPGSGQTVLSKSIESEPTSPPEESVTLTAARRGQPKRPTSVAFWLFQSRGHASLGCEARPMAGGIKRVRQSGWSPEATVRGAGRFFGQLAKSLFACRSLRRVHAAVMCKTRSRIVQIPGFLVYWQRKNEAQACGCVVHLGSGARIAETLTTVLVRPGASTHLPRYRTRVNRRCHVDHKNRFQPLDLQPAICPAEPHLRFMSSSRRDPSLRERAVRTTNGALFASWKESSNWMKASTLSRAPNDESEPANGKFALAALSTTCVSRYMQNMLNGVICGTDGRRPVGASLYTPS